MSLIFRVITLRVNIVYRKDHIWPLMTSTKDRILETSLSLFNRQGERNVTTNHIADALGISPGNLYYHFRNKSDIIYEIFQEYEKLVDYYLDIPEDRAITLEDLTFYLESVFDGRTCERG